MTPLSVAHLTSSVCWPLCFSLSSHLVTLLYYHRSPTLPYQRVHSRPLFCHYSSFAEHRVSVEQWHRWRRCDWCAGVSWHYGLNLAREHVSHHDCRTHAHDGNVSLPMNGAAARNGVIEGRRKKSRERERAWRERERKRKSERASERERESERGKEIERKRKRQRDKKRESKRSERAKRIRFVALCLLNKETRERQ